jgi:nickel/cobalt exporter
VPKGSHDRTATVRVTRDAVVVEYRLEVDPWTVVFEDLPAVGKQADLDRLSRPSEFYEAYTRLHAPVLAAGLSAAVDDKELTFACVKHGYEVLTDHLRCDFVFRAPCKPEEGTSHRLRLEDRNFLGRPGQGRLTPAAGDGIQMRPEGPEGKPDEKARVVRVSFELSDSAGAADGAAPPGPESPPATGPDSSLLRLFLESRYGLGLLLLFSALLGAAHALTPGHGKTLVAAYLIGERGTVAHALVLGLVTTLTHTGGVLVLAVVLGLFFPRGISGDERVAIQRAIELVGGILIAALGFWLLLRRLSGRADHFHLGASGHHHHHNHDGHAHHHGPHDHDHHGHPHHHPVQGGWWGLIVLGVSGGIVPCWDAVALLVAAVAMNLLGWALPMLLAFSAGLAGVLVLIGILVVKTKALAGKRWEKSRAYRALPLVSAALVTGLGLWLCYSSVRGGAPQ